MLSEEFRKAPFLKLLLPLLGGMILGRELSLQPVHVPALVLGAGGLLLSPCLIRGISRPLSAVRGGILLAAFFLAGIGLGQEWGTEPVPCCFIQARVCGSPEFSGNGTRILVDRILVWEGDRMVRLRGRASLFLATGIRGTGNIRTNREMPVKAGGLDPGSLVFARCSLEPYQAPLNPEQFDYGAYQRGRGILYQAWVDPASWSPAGEAPHAGPGIRALRLRQKLMDRLEERIPGKAERGILDALLLGYRAGMDPLAEQDFARSGTMHILAVSGLHVGIIYLLPAFLLKYLRRRRVTGIVGLLAVSALLWGYAFLTGLSSSVVRAVCMCCIHGTAMVSRRRISPLHVVSLAAFLMAVARPAAIFEAGFQLSFAAVTGILLMYRGFLSLFPFPGRAGRWLSRMLSVSLAAQLATLPLTVFYFHQASPMAFLANLVIVPVAGLILYAGSLFFLFSGVSPLAGILASALEYGGRVLLWISRTAAGIPGSWIGGLSLNPLQLVLLYLSGLFILYYLRLRSPRRLFLVLFSLVLLISVSAVREFRIRMHRGLYVFALRRETAILFVEGRNAALFRGFDSAYDKCIPYGLEGFCSRYRLHPPLQFTALDILPGGAANPLSLEFTALDTLPGEAAGLPSLPGLTSLPVRSPGIDAVCIDFLGMRILVLGRWDRHCFPANTFPGTSSLETNLLVLCNNPAVSITELCGITGISTVVADGSNRPWFAKRTGPACLESGIRFHYTGTEGCYARRIRGRQKKTESFGIY